MKLKDSVNKLIKLFNYDPLGFGKENLRRAAKAISIQGKNEREYDEEIESNQLILEIKRDIKHEPLKGLYSLDYLYSRVKLIDAALLLLKERKESYRDELPYFDHYEEVFNRRIEFGNEMIRLLRGGIKTRQQELSEKGNPIEEFDIERDEFTRGLFIGPVKVDLSAIEIAFYLIMLHKLSIFPKYTGSSFDSQFSSIIEQNIRSFKDGEYKELLHFKTRIPQIMDGRQYKSNDTRIKEFKKKLRMFVNELEQGILFESDDKLNPARDKD